MGRRALLLSLWLSGVVLLHHDTSSCLALSLRDTLIMDKRCGRNKSPFYSCPENSLPATRCATSFQDCICDDGYVANAEEEKCERVGEGCDSRTKFYHCPTNSRPSTRCVTSFEGCICDAGYVAHYETETCIPKPTVPRSTCTLLASKGSKVEGSIDFLTSNKITSVVTKVQRYSKKKRVSFGIFKYGDLSKGCDSVGGHLAGNFPVLAENDVLPADKKYVHAQDVVGRAVVLFESSGDSRGDEQSDPYGHCRYLYDGCNECHRNEPNEEMACTKMHCYQYKEKICHEWFPMTKSAGSPDDNTAAKPVACCVIGYGNDE